MHSLQLIFLYIYLFFYSSSLFTNFSIRTLSCTYFYYCY